jgi:hypothetical protein
MRKSERQLTINATIGNTAANGIDAQFAPNMDLGDSRPISYHSHSWSHTT